MPKGFIHIVNNANVTCSRKIPFHKFQTSKINSLFARIQTINKQMPCPKPPSPVLTASQHSDIRDIQLLHIRLRKQKYIREASAFDGRV